MDLAAFLGAVKSQGPLAPAVQKVLQAHCAAGHIAAVADVVATALLDKALGDASFPQPRGLRTAALAGQALDASKQLAQGYAHRGVLCAKGYMSAGQLTLIIFGKWEQLFSSVLQHPEATHGLPGVTHPDHEARSAVAAQALFLRVLQGLPRSPEGDHILLPMKDVEHICRSAVTMMYSAYTQPDEMIHGLLHGDSDDGDGKSSGDDLG